MHKVLWSFFLSFLLLFYCFKPAFAEGEFVTDASIYYDVLETGTTTVSHYITLENVFTDIYATNYALNLFGIDPISPAAYQAGKKLPTVVNKEKDRTSITVAFDDAVVGRGAQRQFSITYSDKSVITKTGEVWEVIIPRLSNPDDFDDYQVTLRVPLKLGDVAYISPKPVERYVQDENSIFVFSKSEISNTPITAAFGKFQVLSFDLTYHLENPLNKIAYTEVALPPDTSYQKVILQYLDPKPSQVRVDSDGNWLAKYILNPRQQIDVKTKGSVQLFSEPRSLGFPDLSVLEDSKKPSSVWQVDNADIQRLATQLKTPRAIYDYVVSTLEYDYERVRPNVDRFGAVEALKNPKHAICMEFTDLFVAITRAAGIPAREINGYAYTENPELQPLSLVSDVLHSWAEYWDESKQMWIQVDPTWGKTSGTDFFSKLDLRHFAFVIHGKDPYQPYPPGSYKLGPNPQKDVYVDFGTLPESRFSQLDIVVSEAPLAFFKPTSHQIMAENIGSLAMDNPQIDVYFDDEKVQSFGAQTLPPYGNITFQVEVPFNILGHNMPNTITLKTADQSVTVATHRQSVIIANLAAIMIVFFILLLAVFLRVKRVNIIQFLKRKTYASTAHNSESTKNPS